MHSPTFTADVWTAIVSGLKCLPDHPVLHVIAAILSLLLLAGMFGARTEPADGAVQPAEPAEPDHSRSDIHSNN